MGWCLDCHRDPGQSLRPREQIFDPDWKPAERPRRGPAVAGATYHIQTRPSDGLLDMPSVKELPVKRDRDSPRVGRLCSAGAMRLGCWRRGVAIGLAACSKPAEEDRSLCQDARTPVAGRAAEIRDDACRFPVTAAASSSSRSTAARSKSRAIRAIRRALAQPTSSPRPRSCRCTIPTARAPFSKKATIASRDAFQARRC